MDSNERNPCVCSDLSFEDFSSPFYAWHNYVLIVLALPLLSVFGLATNIANVVIFSRRRLRSPSNTYLLFLACCDFLVIATGLYTYWIDSTKSYIPELKHVNHFVVYVLPLGYMAQTCSTYVLIAAAFNCCINVCHHSASRSSCTVRWAMLICGIIAFCSIIYNVPRFFQFKINSCFHEESQINEICPTEMFFRMNVLYNVYLYLLLMHILPFVFLFILSAIIMARYCLSSQEHSSTEGAEEHLASVNEDLVKMSATSRRDDTITLIMLVILFLVCNTPGLVVNIIESFFDPDYQLLNILTDTSNFLVIFNASANFFVYFIFHKEYRKSSLNLCRSRRHPSDTHLPTSHFPSTGDNEGLLKDQLKSDNNKRPE